jgi:outer membrane protein assembly factor BamB
MNHTPVRMSPLTLPRCSSPRRFRLAWLAIVSLLGIGLTTARADDWPQWMGPQRDGIWRETNLLERLPAGGPPILWRTNVQRGYSGPAVVGDRLFIIDRLQGKAPERKPGERSLPVIPGNERVLCLDAHTGARIWDYTYDCAYRISYPAGPRATPLVAGGRVYALGAMGDLLCLDTKDGRVVWQRQFLKDFTEEPPVWGYAAHPLLDGDRLICLVGGTNSAVVAFHKDTGRELWRALHTREIGYAPPVIYTVGEQRQLIIWHPDGVAGLAPETGRVLWTNAYPIGGKPQRPEVTIAMPRLAGTQLFLSSFYQGSLLLDIGAPEPRVVWNRRSKRKSEFEEGLHTTMCTPVIRDRHIFGVCGFGEFRCLDLATGDRRWESYQPTEGKKSLFGQVFIVEQAGRYWLWNDQGELILARLSPSGYEEISRAKLLPTIEHTRGRDVLWCHPAFAHRRLYVHNGQELICVSLDASAPVKAG